LGKLRHDQFALEFVLKGGDQALVEGGAAVEVDAVLDADSLGQAHGALCNGIMDTGDDLGLGRGRGRAGR